MALDKDAVMKEIDQRGYAHPEALVTTQWVEAHLDDPSIRLIESNEDTLLYGSGHVPGAAHVDWITDLNDHTRRDYISAELFGALMSRLGVTPETTVVFYGDKNNWWATYSFWVLRLFGLSNLRVMDGGRQRWAEEGRQLTTEAARYPEGNIVVGERDEAGIRAFRDEVLEHVRQRRSLVDVRSPEEYRGERLHMPEYPSEGALRGGHIPGARSIPWGRAVNPETHTFRPAGELRTIYEQENGLTPDGDTIVYCRIGERSSHTWFALTYLLGFERVRNYDGSWTEWGNAVRLPIEKP